MKHLLLLLLAIPAFGQNKLKQSPHKHLFSIEVQYDKIVKCWSVRLHKRGEPILVQIRALIILRRRKAKGKYIAYLSEKVDKRQAGSVIIYPPKLMFKNPDWEHYAYRVTVYDEQERLVLSVRNSKMRKFASIEERIMEFALNQKDKYVIFNSRGFKLGIYQPEKEK